MVMIMSNLLERLNPFSKSKKQKVEQILYVSNAASIVIRHPVDGSTKTIHKGNKNFDTIKTSLENGDFETALQYIDIPTHIETMSEGNVIYRDSKLLWKNEEVNTYLAERIVKLIQTASEEETNVNKASKYMKFLDKLHENTSNRVYEQCFQFLEHHGFNIDDDGDILAYKRVSSELYDLWSGTVKYTIGSVVEMPRRDVSDDPNDSCASGLHFCTLRYVNAYMSSSGGKIILMKIDPRDVVSVPKSETSKGRCCKLKVLNVYRDDD